ncbi:hypothetical protein OK348_03135 [Flavobacterium sp. MXW15]|uniref:Uncharacterized protein n=1 Tax=Xanthomonas chitinilytica TaxID=2989819 RepID=A0ABT3JRQ6_9XANT|nr:hypothetical protein [Xanthomonas sp. H13-6]MCW4453791.1 hypothetical protein [Flavobacterium sp. MXW15]MCW4471161.1 hypothetical protein [Xanthomonas sp. H13-6]
MSVLPLPGPTTTTSARRARATCADGPVRRSERHLHLGPRRPAVLGQRRLDGRDRLSFEPCPQFALGEIQMGGGRRHRFRLDDVQHDQPGRMRACQLRRPGQHDIAAGFEIEGGKDRTYLFHRRRLPRHRLSTHGHLRRIIIGEDFGMTARLDDGEQDPPGGARSP